MFVKESQKTLKTAERIVIPSQVQEEKLVPGAVVILGQSRDVVKRIGLDGSNTVFRQAEGVARYRRQLEQIIKSKPRCVIFVPSARYAELNVSRANFENLVRDAGSMFRDSVTPLIFVTDQPDAESPRIEQFNDVLKEYCQLQSLPLLSDAKDIAREVNSLKKSGN